MTRRCVQHRTLQSAEGLQRGVLVRQRQGPGGRGEGGVAASIALHAAEMMLIDAFYSIALH